MLHWTKHGTDINVLKLDIRNAEFIDCKDILQNPEIKKPTKTIQQLSYLRKR